MHMMQPVEAPAQTPHNPFDVCDCQDCLDEAYKLEYEEEDNQRKKKGSQFTLKQRYEAGDQTVGLLGEPSGKFDYYVLYGAKPADTEHTNQTLERRNMSAYGSDTR
ncbi:hypothetical protein QVD17_35050 [Tagetes erecta]|uniref:Uncharacterized protein n=1 Tax=Tagetes erecta TaxID=13708 RepID=A0AAD8K0C4_TARER|nr:hypothetical protein QVD17_35050 [Tagetes erecta]